MRLPLEITPSFSSQLPLTSTSANDPPLLFIDSEPFIVELQGKLELPEGEAVEDGFGSSTDDASRLRGSRVGKVDLSDPVSFKVPSSISAASFYILEVSEEVRSIQEWKADTLDALSQKKPTMRIAHHRLEGKLETLLTPYALLRTSKRHRGSSTKAKAGGGGECEESNSERSSKRTKLGAGGESMAGVRESRKDQLDLEEEGESTQIEIVGIIRKKIVFNKRPEPLIEISSEADPMVSAASKKEKEAKRGPKGFLGFGGGKR
ncbi:hypothetical protein JCM3765_000279 [Sporobolomyces pararoseus]